MNSLRLLIALEAEYDMKIHQMDVITAYFNGEIVEEIYMKKKTKLLKGMVELKERRLVN